MTKQHLRSLLGNQWTRTVFIIVALTVTACTASPVVASFVRTELQKDFAALMTQAKLQADLGNHQQAADAFASIARDSAAPAALRGEAMVRCGLALNAAGDIRASAEVFKEAIVSFRTDPKTLRFLTYAVAGTVPGKIWPDFQIPFEDLLKNAEVVSSDELARGETAARRVRLKKDEIELRAVWRPFPPTGEGAYGSYKAEIAAYELDKMLGLNMVPPTMERTLEGRPGSIQLWVNGCKAYKQVQGKIPETSRWNHQVASMNLFDALVGNAQRDEANNVLIDPNWEIVRIDHLFAFSSETELRNPPAQFDRRLVARLRALREDDLQTRLKGILSRDDIRNVLKRRDALLSHLAKLVAEKGEAAVLF